MMVIISYSIIFACIIILSLLDKKTSKKAVLISKLSVVILIISVIASYVSLLLLFGPSKSTGGTQMTSAMNKLTGGWSEAIFGTFILWLLIGIVLIGLVALFTYPFRKKELAEKKKQQEYINDLKKNINSNNFKQ